MIDLVADWFADAYEGNPPWDIGRHQPVFERLVAGGEITSPVLDVGCGTGENALYLAARGFEVVGVDAVDLAVGRARRKASARGLHVEFLAHDALALDQLGRRFATVIDCGLFHTFDDDERLSFVRSLSAVFEPAGRYFVLCFSENERRDGGPRRVTQAELREIFDRPPFRVLSIEAAEFSSTLPGGGRKAWLARVERPITA